MVPIRRLTRSPPLVRHSCLLMVVIGLCFIVAVTKLDLQNAVFFRKSDRLEFHMRNDDDDDNLPSFRILQIADLHLGENSWDDWGPKQDRKTFVALHKIITAERPDMIVLSGDQITANNIYKNATSYYKLLLDHLVQYNVPWATIYGNHDDMAYMNPVTKQKSPPLTTRADLVRIDRHYKLSQTQVGPIALSPGNNYMVPLYFQNRAVAQLVLLDSGGGSLRSAISQSQLTWLQSHLSSTVLPSFAFQHIPSKEFKFYKDSCVGDNLDKGFSPLSRDAGIISTLSAGGVHFLAVGHNHGNDYCCPFPRNATSNKIHLCFGRHSGYGGYTRNETRGGRVYKLQLTAQGEFHGWSSHVRLETGEIVNRYTPTSDDAHKL